MPPEILQKRDPVAVRRILESLPDWFGDPGAIDNYEMAAADIEFVSIVAVDSGNVIGVSLTRRHFRESAELHLIAVDPMARGRGIGRALIDHVAADLRNDGGCCCRFIPLGHLSKTSPTPILVRSTERQAFTRSRSTITSTGQVQS